MFEAYLVCKMHEVNAFVWYIDEESVYNKLQLMYQVRCAYYHGEYSLEVDNLQYAVTLAATFDLSIESDNTSSHVYKYLCNRDLVGLSKSTSTLSKRDDFYNIYNETVDLLEYLGCIIYSSDTYIPQEYDKYREVANGLTIKDKDAIVIFNRSSLWHEAIHFLQGKDASFLMQECSNKGYKIHPLLQSYEEEGIASFFNYELGVTQHYSLQSLVAEVPAFAVGHHPEVVMNILRTF